MSGFSSLYEKVHERLPGSPRWSDRSTYRRLESFGGSRVRSARLPIILAAFCLSALFFVCLSNNQSTPYNWSNSTGGVHLLIPASNPDPNLCKAVMSAAILGYPTPKIINWGMVFNDTKLVSGGSHIAKISGVKQYLEHLESRHDDDLVIMVDGYDIWFQLRPQTLLDRYFDINRRANERIRSELGANVMQKYNIKQDIVFSVQKRCWPWSEDDSPCYAMPQSTLPTDAFGNATDTDVGNKQNPYIKFRPRYLNSGIAVGTAKAMRALFTEALRRAEEDSNFGSDQHIFSRIFGEQEVWREVVRRREMGWIQRLRVFFQGDAHADQFKQSDIDMSKFHNQPMEFSIGADYEGSLGLPTVFSEDDTEWLTFSNASQISAANALRNISASDNRLHLESDIANTPLPLTSSGGDVLRETSWSDTQLFTNVWTGVTPAIIHHNAHRDGLKSLRESWWDRIWFQHDARALMEIYMREPAQPVALSAGREWRSVDEVKGGVRDDAGAWLPYQDVCQGTEEEVFRDGRGPWVADKHH